MTIFMKTMKLKYKYNSFFLIHISQITTEKVRCSYSFCLIFSSKTNSKNNVFIIFLFLAFDLVFFYFSKKLTERTLKYTVFRLQL